MIASECLLLDPTLPPAAACKCSPRRPLFPQLLHEHGAPLDAIAEGDGGATPFLTACSNGKLEILIWLKQAGANLKATGDEGQDGLSIAAREGYLKVVKWLHEVSANECIRVRLMAL